MSSTPDVIVMGGGLAGLTLARQLTRRRPGTRVTLLERSTRPLPRACHKVGESSVEVGTHYFAEVLGLRPYLEREHLPKNGLRFFCGRGDIEDRTEIGPGELPPVPSFQLDRGKLESDLRAMVAPHVDLREGWSVRDIELSSDGAHRVRATAPDGQLHALGARWVVDATGRRRLLRPRLGLARGSAIDASAAWFRIAGRVDPASLASPSAVRWRSRDPRDHRWLSTNHLTGRGYWVWLIPLATGHTSVGIVADRAEHPDGSFHREASARAWLADHEPALAARLDGVPFEDFGFVRDYSYGAEAFLGESRWACVGEAAFFVDPLYSPGSDFIAFTNTFATELIADDLEGRFDPARLRAFEALLLPMARDLERTLGGQGSVFEHPEVLSAKLWWDYYVYWAFMAAYFFHRIYRLDAAGQAPFLELRTAYEALNQRMQSVFRAWAELRTRPAWKPRPFVPLPMGLSSLTELHLELTRPKTPQACEARMRRDLREAEVMARELLFRALHGVGHGNAAELGRRVDLASWDLPCDPARIAAEELPRAARRDRLPRTGRDLDRALGRATDEGGVPLRRLLEVAGSPLAAP
ncbi:MAG: NAD(P)/FAD-dependent oxidoreductase [Sandaracinaceae bacterium]